MLDPHCRSWRWARCALPTLRTTPGARLEASRICDSSHVATALSALQGRIEAMERAMTDHVVRPVDSRDPRTTDLNEAELSTASGGTTGAGAGKVTFNPFVITKHVDKATPILF